LKETTCTPSCAKRRARHRLVGRPVGSDQDLPPVRRVVERQQILDARLDAGLFVVRHDHDRHHRLAWSAANAVGPYACAQPGDRRIAGIDVTDEDQRAPEHHDHPSARLGHRFGTWSRAVIR
jgi:hypothetical protein